MGGFDLVLYYLFVSKYFLFTSTYFACQKMILIFLALFSWPHSVAIGILVKVLQKSTIKFKKST